MKRKGIVRFISKTIGTLAVGLAMPICANVIALLYKLFIKVICPKAISKLAVIMTINTYISAQIVGIYVAFRLISKLWNNYYESDFDNSICDVMYDSDDCVGNTVIPFFTLAISGFFTGKAIVFSFMDISRIIA